MIQMRKVFILLLSLFCLPTLYAASDTIRLEFDHFAQGPKYYNSGDWYVVLENEEDWEVYLNWKAPKDDYTGRFITTKFLHDYSCWGVSYQSFVDGRKRIGKYWRE